MGKEGKYMNNKQEFSERLNHLLDHYGVRKKNKGRQVDLAELLDVRQESARRWLEGEIIPSRNNLLAICSKFPCRVEWLERGEGRMISNPKTETAMELFERLSPEDQDHILGTMERYSR